MNRRTQPETRIILIAAFLAVACLGFAQGSDREIYDKAVELYLQKDLDGALEQFQDLVDGFPKSIKIDDALWYIGRIYRKQDKLDEAIASFQAVLDLGSKKNRYNDAAYDLGSIYLKQDRFNEMIDLLTPFAQLEDPKPDDQKNIRLLARTWYIVGLRAGRDDRIPDARQAYAHTVDLYRLLLPMAEDQDRASLLYSLGKAYNRLRTTAPNTEAYNTAREQALDVLEEGYAAAESTEQAEEGEKIQQLIEKIKDAEQPVFKLDLEALGGTDSLSLQFGAQASLDLALEIPVGWHQILEIGLGVDHDNFSVKTFGFDTAGDSRLIQRTDRFDVDLSWQAGDKDMFYSQMTAGAAYRLAADLEDNYLALDFAEDLSYRFDPNWKLGLDTQFTWKDFPNYLINGRELDYILLEASPELIWYLPGLRSELRYGYALKQYLNAKYDLQSGGSATKNRQYQTHSLELDLNGSVGPFRPGLGYTVTFNKSYNYDVLVTANPADRFVRDYYDYLEHAFNLEADFRWTDRLRTDLNGSAAFRNFLNYPARDATDTFIDELRRDMAFEVEGSIRYIVWPEARNGLADVALIASGSWLKVLSNMTYEASFETNYELLRAFGGLSLNLN